MVVILLAAHFQGQKHPPESESVRAPSFPTIPISFSPCLYLFSLSSPILSLFLLSQLLVLGGDEPALGLDDL